MTKKITWPHEVVYNSQDQLAGYDDMGIALFINGYLTVLGVGSDEVKFHAHPFTGGNGRCRELQLDVCEKLPCIMATADRTGQGHMVGWI